MQKQDISQSLPQISSAATPLTHCLASDSTIVDQSYASIFYILLRARK